MPGRNELVDRWISMWNEPDPDARRKIVDDIWAPDGVYVFFNLDPRVGRDAIYRQVTVVNRIYTTLGHRFVSQHDARGHHNLVRFGWAMLHGGTGEVDMIGNDVLVLDEDGRIKADYEFHDLLSSVNYADLPPFDEFAPDLVPQLPVEDLEMYRAVFEKLRFATPVRA